MLDWECVLTGPEALEMLRFRISALWEWCEELEKPRVRAPMDGVGMECERRDSWWFWGWDWVWVWKLGLRGDGGREKRGFGAAAARPEYGAEALRESYEWRGFWGSSVGRERGVSSMETRAVGESFSAVISRGPVEEYGRVSRTCSG